MLRMPPIEVIGQAVKKGFQFTYLQKQWLWLHAQPRCPKLRRF